MLTIQARQMVHPSKKGALNWGTPIFENEYRNDSRRNYSKMSGFKLKTVKMAVLANDGVTKRDTIKPKMVPEKKHVKTVYQMIANHSKTLKNLK